MHLDGGDKVIIVTFVYPCGTVSVSSQGYFLSVGYYSKPPHTSLPLSLGARHMQQYFNNKRGIKRRFIKPEQEKAGNEERMKQFNVILRETFVAGYWELISM